MEVLIFIHSVLLVFGAPMDHQEPDEGPTIQTPHAQSVALTVPTVVQPISQDHGLNLEVDDPMPSQMEQSESRGYSPFDRSMSTEPPSSPEASATSPPQKHGQARDESPTVVRPLSQGHGQHAEGDELFANPPAAPGHYHVPFFAPVPRRPADPSNGPEETCYDNVDEDDVPRPTPPPCRDPWDDFDSERSSTDASPSDSCSSTTPSSDENNSNNALLEEADLPANPDHCVILRGLLCKTPRHLCSIGQILFLVLSFFKICPCPTGTWINPSSKGDGLECVRLKESEKRSIWCSSPPSQ
ncbi:hypothetical protein BLNAU_21215 [Blattamonas nauphoetae]|uniref:Uncharacterized protein n=1 Tax=Blattamonas nauphoetae TaxID=2049346 RepID=A0ABQ9WWI8_9EUKA|nr:hypothetical protein BLNAU_21215 [Blattamonas nauphoetae]